MPKGNTQEGFPVVVSKPIRYKIIGVKPYLPVVYSQVGYTVAQA